MHVSSALVISSCLLVCLIYTSYLIAGDNQFDNLKIMNRCAYTSTAYARLIENELLLFSESVQPGRSRYGPYD